MRETDDQMAEAQGARQRQQNKQIVEVSGWVWRGEVVMVPWDSGVG